MKCKLTWLVVDAGGVRCMRDDGIVELDFLEVGAEVGDQGTETKMLVCTVLIEMGG